MPNWMIIEPTEPEKSDRNAAQMAALYQSGLSLRQIGSMYGITGEWVRRVIQPFALAREECGVAARAAKKQIQKEQNLDALYMEKYGVSRQEYVRLAAIKNKSGASIRKDYTQQRNSAKARNIQWNLTFPQWARFWLESGCIDKRGRGRDSYCMGRINDTGAYELGNIYISTLAANSSRGVHEGRSKVKCTKLREFIKGMGGVAEISEFLGVSVGLLQNYCVKGRLPNKWAFHGTIDKLASHPKSPFTKDQWIAKFVSAADKVGV